MEGPGACTSQYFKTHTNSTVGAGLTALCLSCCNRPQNTPHFVRTIWTPYTRERRGVYYSLSMTTFPFLGLGLPPVRVCTTACIQALLITQVICEILISCCPDTHAEKNSIIKPLLKDSANFPHLRTFCSSLIMIITSDLPTSLTSSEALILSLGRLSDVATINMV